MNLKVTLHGPALSLLSETFDDGQALLRIAEKRGVEGLASKRLGRPENIQAQDRGEERLTG